MSKYKVGDKVRIKSNLHNVKHMIGEYSPLDVIKMREGKIVTIADVLSNPFLNEIVYEIEEDEQTNGYPEEWLESVPTLAFPETLRVGDILVNEDSNFEKQWVKVLGVAGTIVFYSEYAYSIEEAREEYESCGFQTSMELIEQGWKAVSEEAEKEVSVIKTKAEIEKELGMEPDTLVIKED
jgi:hypothetical protein